MTCYCEPPNTLEECSNATASSPGWTSWKPCQAVGIEAMFTQLTLSASYRNILGGECVTNLGLMFPGVHGDAFTAIKSAQLTYALQIVDILRMTYGEVRSSSDLRPTIDALARPRLS